MSMRPRYWRILGVEPGTDVAPPLIEARGDHVSPLALRDASIEGDGMMELTIGSISGRSGSTIALRWSQWYWSQ